MDFTGFKEVLPNCVYAIHDYATMGFPAGTPYEGTDEQKEFLRKSYERKVQFMREHKVPIWNGEFGPVYAGPDDPNQDKINQQRYNEGCIEIRKAGCTESTRKGARIRATICCCRGSGP